MFALMGLRRIRLRPYCPWQTFEWLCFCSGDVVLGVKRRFDSDSFRIIDYRAMSNCRNLAPREDGVVLRCAAGMDVGLLCGASSVAVG